MVGRKERKELGAIYHLGERNGKRERPFLLCCLVWNPSPNSLVYERSKLGYFEIFGVWSSPNITSFLFYILPNNHKRQNHFTNPSVHLIPFPFTLLPSTLLMWTRVYLYTILWIRKEILGRISSIYDVFFFLFFFLNFYFVSLIFVVWMKNIIYRFSL